MSPDRIWILLGKKNNGEASEQELQELESLLASDYESSYTANIIERLWDAPLTSMPGTSLPAGAWDKIMAKLHGVSGKTYHLFFAGWKKWAAAACFAVALSALVYHLIPSGRTAHDALPIAEKMGQVSTQQGSKTKVVLADGTMVWLNANSQLIYGNKNFGADNREVYLSGEAFFDVTKNDKVPFIIHTGAINITVKGTAFNVRAYPGERSTETSLIRGLVEITTQKDPTRKIILKPNEKIIIPLGTDLNEPSNKSGPNSPVSIYTIVPLKKDNTKALAETIWMKTKLEFDNEVFEDLAPKIENWYSIKIHFKDEAIKKRRFSGIIEKETVSEMMQAMQLSFHFGYELTGKDLWISKK